MGDSKNIQIKGHPSNHHLLFFQRIIGKCTIKEDLTKKVSTRMHFFMERIIVSEKDNPNGKIWKELLKAESNIDSLTLKE